MAHRRIKLQRSQGLGRVLACGHRLRLADRQAFDLLLREVREGRKREGCVCRTISTSVLPAMTRRVAGSMRFIDSACPSALRKRR